MTSAEGLRAARQGFFLQPRAGPPALEKRRLERRRHRGRGSGGRARAPPDGGAGEGLQQSADATTHRTASGPSLRGTFSFLSTPPSVAGIG